MNNDNDFEGQTIDMTPKWIGIIYPMLEVFRNYKEKRATGGPRGIDSTLEDLKGEFVKMARAADNWNEYVKAENKEEGR